MKYKWLILAVALLPLSPNLTYPMQAQQTETESHQEPVTDEQHPQEHLEEVRFNYTANLLQRLLFAGLNNGPKELIPTFNQYCISDFVTHALYKMLGITHRFTRQVVETGVGQLSHGITSYYNNEQRTSLPTFIIKNVVPFFVRTMAINYVHNAVTSAIGIDYPNTLKRSFLFSFFVAPFISSSLKELIWGTAYDKFTAPLAAA